MSLILNQAQAEAVYQAMCALNNVGATVSAEFHQDGLQAYSLSDGSVAVQNDTTLGLETYNTQADFATAYGLQQG